MEPFQPQHHELKLTEYRPRDYVFTQQDTFHRTSAAPVHPMGRSRVDAASQAIVNYRRGAQHERPG
jgi:hypothetical protein